MKSKLLVRINNLEDIKIYQKEGINNFLFPLEEFSIGYNSFNIDELKDIDANIYILVNRVFDNETCDNFKNISKKLLFAKGIVFEDIAVYQILKNEKVNLIWNQMHFNVSYNSINIWLNEYNIYSSFVSSELEKNELNNVLNKVSKKVILPVLGLNISMYSRRYLLSYYNEHASIKNVKCGILKTNNNIEFLAKENIYGTVLFYHKYYNLIPKLNEISNENILLYYIDPNELTSKDIIDIINGKEIDFDNRFYENKTVYRVGDLND